MRKQLMVIYPLVLLFFSIINSNVIAKNNDLLFDTLKSSIFLQIKETRGLKVRGNKSGNFFLLLIKSVPERNGFTVAAVYEDEQSAFNVAAVFENILLKTAPSLDTAVNNLPMADFLLPVLIVPDVNGKNVVPEKSVQNSVQLLYNTTKKIQEKFTMIPPLVIYSFGNGFRM